MSRRRDHTTLAGADRIFARSGSEAEEAGGIGRSDCWGKDVLSGISVSEATDRKADPARCWLARIYLRKLTDALEKIKNLKLEECRFRGGRNE
ncbi:MAG: hypothetical protein LBT92_03775 [Rickettsiales bacterium]|jgi:hypothetical protein|nr:hypothetical protein [Rickettsiales bacterium]